MSDLFNMGGYGIFIWPAYLIAAIILIGILIQSIVAMRQRENILKRLREEHRGSLIEKRE